MTEEELGSAAIAGETTQAQDVYELSHETAQRAHDLIMEYDDLADQKVINIRDNETLVFSKNDQGNAIAEHEITHQLVGADGRETTTVKSTVDNEGVSLAHFTKELIEES